MREPVASNIEWKAWGEKDPLMGVATRAGKHSAGAQPWCEEEFYELGRRDWADFSGRWKRYGLDSESCLEIGCGTGRYTQQLAQEFKTVYALDVSEKMIEYARRRISEPSIRFLLGNGVEVQLPDASVTAAFSTHVFQHFDSLSHGARYFQEVARVLRSGGTMMIHLPIHHWPAMPTLFDMAYGIRKGVGDVRAWLKRRLIRAGLSHHHFMRGQSYPLPYLFERLPALGLTDVEIAVFPTEKEQVLHPFVFARRDSTSAPKR